MNVEVRNNPTEYRYEVWADGQLAGFLNTSGAQRESPSYTPKSMSPTRAWAWVAGWPGRHSTMRAPGDWW